MFAHSKQQTSTRRVASQARRKQDGFSLLEMLVVLAIMGLLATLVAPRLFSQIDRSKITAAKAQARSIRTSLDAMRLDIGRYPTAEEGLALLTAPPADPSLRTSWLGPYLEGQLPNDPWGNPYRYSPPGTDAAGFALKPRIYSFGADNQEGGNGMNADIEI